MKVAFVTGITGQDGSYLAELLLEKGYTVHGIMRRSSSINTGRIDHIFDRLRMHYGDMTDYACLFNIINAIRPDEIYNLAAQSHVKVSFEMEKYTTEVNALGVVNLLQAIVACGLTNKTRLYQASTSEMYGNVSDGRVLLDEESPMHPVSPYGIAKLHAYHTVRYYREGHGVFACNGILFNHESPRRGETFVTRKITRHVGSCARNGVSEPLQIGNLDATRDWGHARDYVKGMWLMLQQEEPADFVLATGETHSVREFIELAFRHIGKTVVWHVRGDGTGMEYGVDGDTGETLVEVNPRYYRPIDILHLIGDCSRARERLGWQAEFTFQGLVENMVAAEVDRKN